MEEELMAIQKNRTRDLLNNPQGKKANRLKWVLRTKYHADGSIQKHKLKLTRRVIPNNKVLTSKKLFLLLHALKQGELS